MQICQGDGLRRLLNAVRQRVREAMCLPVESAGKTSDFAPTPGEQQGSAVVEFTFLALLLMVPVVYFVVTVGRIQGGSFGVVGAADQAAKVFVAQRDPASARAAAERSVLVALKDHGHSVDQASITIDCDRENCLSAGTTVTVTVRLDVSLPLMPFGDVLQLKASRLSASASQVVGRYQ
ncbi:hypothetical protein [Paenarthrobacter sp.]|uniref:hypothetical protein n=1 Tax=Paenarthrobacter sp. TaxID=1931993 RepID=UPI002811FC33|nr:hypothetical protein [Paenarthrobacter sp.]